MGFVNDTRHLGELYAGGTRQYVEYIEVVDYDCLVSKSVEHLVTNGSVMSFCDGLEMGRVE